MTYPLSRTTGHQPAAGRGAEAQTWMSLRAFAATTGLHPQLLRRLVTLGLLDPYVDASGQFWFPPAQLSRLARAWRLRAGLGLNYAALGVVLDLLARIEELEAAQRTA
jgi:DNA-binding transcriptional MerR regulator